MSDAPAVGTHLVVYVVIQRVQALRGRGGGGGGLRLRGAAHVGSLHTRLPLPQSSHCGRIPVAIYFISYLHSYYF